MADQHGKANLLQRRRECLAKLALSDGIAAKERLEIQRRNLIIVVELVGRMFGEAIGVGLRHLVVSREVAVDGIDVGHGRELVAGASKASRAKVASQCSPI